MDNLVQSFKNSLHKGFIDQDVVEHTVYKPELLINNEAKNTNVLNSLIHELKLYQLSEIIIKSNRKKF